MEKAGGLLWPKERRGEDRKWIPVSNYFLVSLIIIETKGLLMKLGAVMDGHPHGLGSEVSKQTSRPLIFNSVIQVNGRTNLYLSLV